MCNTISTVQKDYLIVEPQSCAVRGRYTGKNGETEQHLELGDSDIANCLTSVAKDSMILEKNEMNDDAKIIKVGQIRNEGSKHGTVASDEGLFPSLVAGTHGYANPHVYHRYRIRKITEREAYRLMDFSDEDFEKGRAVSSKTQMYKTAGNSIICNVLVALFGQMFEGKENIYKEINELKGDVE